MSFDLNEKCWVNVSVRLPETGGTYRVIRRGLRSRPRWEDDCVFIPADGTAPARWKNARGVIVQTVEYWKETDA